MKRIALVTALTTALALAGAVPAGAGVDVGPSAYKILKGALGSDDPITELQSDDNDYFFVISNSPPSGDVASYQLTFTDVPDVEGTTQLRIILAAKGTPTCTVRMWHWRKDKFVTVGDPIAVAGSEGDTLIPLENANRFVRRGKARAKVTCTDDASFVLGTELARFIP